MSVDVSARPAPRTPRQRHTPRVRRLAAEAGVDLAGVSGSGPSGRVTTDDVRRATVAVDTGPDLATMHGIPASRGRAPIGPAVHLTSVVEVDVTTVLPRAAQLDAPAARSDTPSGLTAVLARAALEALAAQPTLNAAVDPDEAGAGTRPVNLGVVIDTERGTVVPVLPDAGSLNLVALAERIRGLADQARSGADNGADGCAATFTVADTGSRGALWETPTLAPGQVAALGAGAVVERPAVVHRADGERVLAIRSTVHLALTYDHRHVDGSDAMRFLTTVRGRLEAGRFDPDLG